MAAIALGYAGTEPKTAERAKGAYKRYTLALGASLAVLAGALYVHQWMTVGRFIESTDDAYVGGDVTAIAPHVAGFVAKIPVDDNQFVHKGELLAQLDNRDFRAAADHAEAVVSQTKASLADLEAKYTLQQSTIRQAGAALASNVAQAQFAREDNQRYRALMESGATSKQSVDKALAADREAAASVAAARESLAGARDQLSVLSADIAEARANVAQAEADLKMARLNLGYTEIRSPVDGYIGNRAAHVGAYVTVGSYLVSVVPAHGLWVDANFKEDQLRRIKPGESVTVTADVLPGHKFVGRVESVAPGTGSVFSVIPAENATGNFTKIVQRVPVRIALDGEDARLGGLRPGLSITASVDTRE